MIPKSGNINLRGVLADCGVSTMYGNGRLSSYSIRDRTAGTTSGPVSMRALAGTCTSFHREVNGMWNATNYNTGVANKKHYLNPGSLECSCSINTLRIGCSRSSSSDQWAECHYHGYAVGGGSYTLSGTIKGFGSANAAAAPAQISIITASGGFLAGSIGVEYNLQSYGTFSNRPVNVGFTVPAGRPYVTLALYQLVFGPNHQPASDGIAPSGQKYLTEYTSMRITKL